MISKNTNVNPIGGNTAILAAMDACRVITSTIGPFGRSYGISIGKGSAPVMSKDGFFLSQEIKGKTQHEDIGVRAVSSACRKVVNVAGDGTTTTAALILGILKALPKKYNLREVIEGLNSFSMRLEERIGTAANTNVTIHDLVKVATTSMNGDAALGLEVATLCSKIGKSGVVFVKDSDRRDEIYTEIEKGYSTDKGVVTPLLLPKPTDDIEINDCAVLLTDDIINSSEELKPIYEYYIEHYFDNKTMKYDKPLVIVAGGFMGSAVEFMSRNLKQNGVPVYGVLAAESGTRRLDVMNDLKFLSGAKRVFSRFEGSAIMDFKATIANNGMGVRKDIEFGSLRKVVTSMKQTTYFWDDTSEKKSAIDEYISDMSDEDKDFYASRKTKMLNGVGFIYVGSDVSVQQTRVAMALDDAQLACFSAMKSGVLPGGGSALIAASEEISAGSVGEKMLKSACWMPLRRMLENASEKPVRSFLKYELDNMQSFYEKGKVYNIISREFEGSEESEVKDVALVLTTAVKSAVGVVIELINLKHTIAWEN